MKQDHAVLNSLVKLNHITHIKRFEILVYKLTDNFIHFVDCKPNLKPLSSMMKVVSNPSMQMEKFDRPVRSVNCYDNGFTLYFQNYRKYLSQSCNSAIKEDFVSKQSQRSRAILPVAPNTITKYLNPI